MGTTTISERLRTDDLLYNRGPNYEPLRVKPSTVRMAAAETIDALASALGLVRSMRSIESLAPAAYQSEVDKRREAWGKIDAEIDAALRLAHRECGVRTETAQQQPTSTETNMNETGTEGDSGTNKTA